MVVSVTLRPSAGLLHRVQRLDRSQSPHLASFAKGGIPRPHPSEDLEIATTGKGTTSIAPQPRSISGGAALERCGKGSLRSVSGHGFSRAASPHKNSCHSEPGRKPGEEPAVSQHQHERACPILRALAKGGIPRPVPLRIRQRHDREGTTSVLPKAPPNKIPSFRTGQKAG
jgi:hypothetical protein